MSSRLPLQPWRVVGRSTEIRTVRRLIEEEGARLVSLVGPAGVGKTRLAVAAADALRVSFSHGVYFIDLTAATSTDRLITAIGGCIGVLNRGERPRLDVIKEYVGPRHVLLVLDNFEHLLTAAPVVGELLAAGSGLVVLTT